MKCFGIVYLIDWEYPLSPEFCAFYSAMYNYQSIDKEAISCDSHVWAKAVQACDDVVCVLFSGNWALVTQGRNYFLKYYLMDNLCKKALMIKDKCSMSIGQFRAQKVF